jgi:hypothetical protein
VKVLNRIRVIVTWADYPSEYEQGVAMETTFDDVPLATIDPWRIQMKLEGVLPRHKNSWLKGPQKTVLFAFYPDIMMGASYGSQKD